MLVKVVLAASVAGVGAVQLSSAKGMGKGEPSSLEGVDVGSFHTDCSGGECVPEKEAKTVSQSPAVRRMRANSANADRRSIVRVGSRLGSFVRHEITMPKADHGVSFLSNLRVHKIADPEKVKGLQVGDVVHSVQIGNNEIIDLSITKLKALIAISEGDVTLWVQRD